MPAGPGRRGGFGQSICRPEDIDHQPRHHERSRDPSRPMPPNRGRGGEQHGRMGGHPFDVVGADQVAMNGFGTRPRSRRRRLSIVIGQGRTRAGYENSAYRPDEIVVEQRRCRQPPHRRQVSMNCLVAVVSAPSACKAQRGPAKKRADKQQQRAPPSAVH